MKVPRESAGGYKKETEIPFGDNANRALIILLSDVHIDALIHELLGQTPTKDLKSPKVLHVIQITEGNRKTVQAVNPMKLLMYARFSLALASVPLSWTLTLRPLVVERPVLPK